MTPENKPPKHPNARIPDECLGCDKEAHRQRSIAHQPNHLHHREHERGYKEYEQSGYECWDEGKQE